MIIESKDYEVARKKLVADPIVINMAKGLAGVPLSEIEHEDGTPRFEFMMMANREYHSREGTNAAHIGAVAEALLRILKAK